MCKRMAAHPFVTVDTEFLRETTCHYPLLCVAQMATADEGRVIDALAPGIDLSPFRALMADEKVMKVFHAARQDIEIIWHSGEVHPDSPFSTPRSLPWCSAMAIPFLRSTGATHHRRYPRQIAPLHRLDAAAAVLDAQLTYAISDVTHLRDVYRAAGRGFMGARGRADWVQEEMSVLTSPETYRMESAERVAAAEDPRGASRGSFPPYSIEASPPGASARRSRATCRARASLKDVDVIAKDIIAIQAPTTIEKLRHLRSLPKGFERSRWGEAIVAAVERGLALDPKTLPLHARPQPVANASAVVELLKVLLRMISERHHVAAKVIATVDDLAHIAADDEADVPALTGWRRELFGEKALALKHGKLALAIEKGRVAPVERD